MSELFGIPYSDVGESTKDLLLKTRGLVKILVGNTFIDLLKDNKLNTGNNSELPVGSIILYSGSDIPDGWSACRNEAINKLIQGIEGVSFIQKEY